MNLFIDWVHLEILYFLEMDSTLNVASAIAGILSMSIQIAQLTQAQTSRAARLPRSIKLYLSELVSLKRLFSDIQDALLLQCVSPGVDAINCQDLPMEISHIQANLEQIREKLQRAQDAAAFPTTMKNLVWPFREDETVEWANDLSECRDRIQATTLASGLRLQILTLGEIKDLRSKMESAETGTNELTCLI
ncbi:hypothetical protein BKA67DRAFT_377914 [Truncatella angustata]|uniref:Fungal N-terminal domain-containing protein n=1 Tax=Truncatella angustata TaxID=152316 RepID=A0A9P8UFP0_9PEZI|nr:uncharacterized protein BKA67DRAFT_377914 [Truncatella angustata]KAH6648963.1 hypothetical protein BKA67DRAFT_377914 [Truncatella angustata]